MTPRTTTSARELAERWGLGLSTVKRSVASGTIPSIQVGRRRLIPLRWVEQREALK